MPAPARPGRPGLAVVLRRHRSARWAPCRGGRTAGGRASGPGRGRSTSPWSRAPITAAPRPAPRPSSPPGSGGWWWPSRTPIPRSPGVVSPACGPPASRSRWGSGRRLAGEQLAAYLKHRRTGRPWVVLKLAASLDGRTAAPDGTSRWITGPAARLDVHRLRAQSDAVLVGAGTVRVDDPALTVRLPPGDPYFRGPDQQPARVVLGRAPAGAAVQPALEVGGDLGRGPRRARGRTGSSSSWSRAARRVAHAFPPCRPGGPVRPVSGSRPVRRG